MPAPFDFHAALAQISDDAANHDLTAPEIDAALLDAAMARVRLSHSDTQLRAMLDDMMDGDEES